MKSDTLEFISEVENTFTCFKCEIEEKFTTYHALHLCELQKIANEKGWEVEVMEKGKIGRFSCRHKICGEDAHFFDYVHGAKLCYFITLEEMDELQGLVDRLVSSAITCGARDALERIAHILGLEVKDDTETKEL